MEELLRRDVRAPIRKVTDLGEAGGLPVKPVSVACPEAGTGRDHGSKRVGAV